MWHPRRWNIWVATDRIATPLLPRSMEPVLYCICPGFDNGNFMCEIAARDDHDGEEKSKKGVTSENGEWK